MKNINIRATALEEFWGTKYTEDLYLWEGAKHNLSLNEIEKIEHKTHPDLFSSLESIEMAMQDCKNIYFKYLPILTKQLNNYHKLNLSVEFWKIAFGYWFYRHICVVYEKYAYLSKIDIDNSSIYLLSTESYYIPFDHDEYYGFFGNDFGVQQLVSEYYKLFATTNFEKIEVEYKKPGFDKSKVVISKKPGFKGFSSFKAPSSVKKLLRNLLNPKIVLVDTYYTMDHIIKLIVKSRGKILPIDKPMVENNTLNYDRSSRENIFQYDSTDKFETYLIKSFAYSIPTIFIENFKNHYNTYLNDIKTSKFSKIVSEGWFGISNAGIYCAVANENSKELIIQEHASACSIVDRSFRWFYLGFPNKLLTTGWKSIERNVVPGGFLAKPKHRYSFANNPAGILFISHTATPYLLEFSWHPSNSNFINELNVINRVIDLIPHSLLSNFKFRPRRSNQSWDTELTLGLYNNEMVDRDNFLKSINNSKIVIIDHMSTGIAELLLNGVPFLILVNRHTSFTNESKPIIDALAHNGILHFTPESLVNKLVKVYDNTESWWKSQEVKNAIQNFRYSFLGAPKNTYNFFTSQLKSI